MKISNDIAKIYGTVQEQKGSEAKIDGARTAPGIKSNEGQCSIETIRIPKNHGTALPPEIRQALEAIFGKEVLLDKEAVQILKTYMDKFPGSLDDKIQVIQNLLSKELDINMTNLKLVHEALFGREVGEIIKELGKDYGIGFQNTGEKSIESLAEEVKSLLAQGVSLNRICDLLESEASDMSPRAKIILTKAVNEGRQATAYRMDDLGQKIIIKALKDAAEEDIEEGAGKTGHKNRESSIAPTFEMKEGAEQEYIASVLGTAGLGGKNYLVTEVTARLRAAGQSFKEFKRDIANNLDMAVRHIEESGASGINNARIDLQKTIDSLDKAILKSDIALFADMKLEKELVKADSQLQKAKTLLDMGEYDKACKLVEKVKTTIESLNWKPSNTRVLHFASLKEGFEEGKSSENKLKTALKGLTQNFSQEDYTPRKVYEALRLLGSDHEGEAARFLAGENVREEELHNNIKSLLFKLSEKGNPMAELAQKVTGSQLLNRTDNGTLQTMFFALPLTINGNVSDMKVYINSKKDEKKLDWQNCSIFFLIDTKKLGETGVLLQASGGNLSITVKNDREDLKDRVSPLLMGFKENLKELGYEVSSIGFARLSAKEGEQQMASSRMINTAANSINPMKKGFDIKI